MTERNKIVWLTRGLALALLLMAIIPLVMYELRDNNRLIVLDGDNSFHITEYASDEKLVTLYKYAATIAVEAFLMRNPKGLDRPQLFDEIYVGEAKKDARLLIKNEILQFSKCGMHQKAEILNIKVIEANSKRSFIKVEGQLIRAYLQGFRKSTYTVKFEMSLGMSPNHDLGDNQLYPFVIDHIKYNQEELKN